MSLLEDYGAYNGTWLMQQDFPPTKYVVDGLIPEGLTYIIAAPKIGKSWMVLDLALAVTQGTPFLGVIPVEKRPVLYLALEDGPKRMQYRARVLGARDLPDSITFAHRLKPEHAVDLMREFMAQHAGQEPLVILDVLGKIKPDKGASQGAYEHDYRVSAALKEVADDHDGSVVVVHHNRKAGSEDFLEDVSGTQGIAGAADTIIVIRRPRTSTAGELHVTSRDASEGSYAVNFVNAKWTLDGDSLSSSGVALAQREATKGLGDPSSQLLAFVNSRDGITKPIDAARALGDLLGEGDEKDRAKRAGTYLKRLADNNRIQHVARGQYTRVESVESVEMNASPQITDPDDIPHILESVEMALEDI